MSGPPIPPPKSTHRYPSDPRLSLSEQTPSIHQSFSQLSINNNNSTTSLVSFPDIPNSSSIELYRQQIKKSDDPQIQLDFAKYLINIAPQASARESTPKAAKKRQDELLNEAIKIIKKLSSQGIGIGKPGYADAQFYLAECYGNGSLNLAINHDKAFGLYVQASKQNHPTATYRVAVCYEVGAGTRKDQSRASQFYRKSASLGDPAAMYKLAMVLLNGYLGNQKNAKEGVTWLKRAAAAANEDTPHALHELGLCYERDVYNGIVIPDEAYARELFTRAAQLGYAPSQYKLGYCYEYGSLTCNVDSRRSITWYSRAAEQGDPEAELALSGWYLTGAETILDQSDSEAYLWAKKAADKGLAKAEYALGYFSEMGIGIAPNMEEGRRWYMRSASQGNKRAIQRLNELSQLGKAPRLNHARKGGDCVIS